MRATCSFTTGICIFGNAPRAAQVACTYPDVSEIVCDSPHVLSLVSDWESIAGQSEKDIVQAVHKATYLRRAASLLEASLSGLSDRLLVETLEQVEECLQTRVSPEDLLSQLLVAPLQDGAAAQQLASVALASGYAAVASVLDHVAELQPLLSRFVSIWLELPDIEFKDLARGREEMWLLLIRSGKLVDLLSSSDEAGFRSKWNILVFNETIPSARSAVAHIGARLAEYHVRRGLLKEEGGRVWRQELPERNEVAAEQERPGHVLYRRALKQVAAIANAVAAGDDTKARRFLRELVEEQTVEQGSHQYAVKSLCNLAQQCADMFRTDIERDCLETALSLSPEDSWTLIQMGDHLKRVGDYQAAIKVLGQAMGGDPEVASSSIADVYAQQGEFDRAIEFYKQIPNWNDRPTVRTAIADVLRRKGDLDAAERVYDELMVEGLGSDRVTAGLAEIAKRRGDLERAWSLYSSLLVLGNLDSEALMVYRLAAANVQKQRGNLDSSYELIDEVIRKSPFNNRARVLRAAILGLKGREQQGLDQIPATSKPRAFGEWVEHYYRGLLLLKLRRFAEAERQLVDNIKASYLSGEQRAILRLGASVAYLMQSNLPEAEEMLSGVPQIHDSYAEYLATVLRYHLAVVTGDQERVTKLWLRLDREKPADAELNKMVLLIRSRDFGRAYQAELNALLKLAA